MPHAAHHASGHDTVCHASRPEPIAVTAPRAALVVLAALAVFGTPTRGVAAQGTTPRLAQHADTTVEWLLDQGYARRRQGDTRGAIESFRRAVERDSSRQVRPLLELAYALLAAGRNVEAVMPLERAVALDGRHDDAHRQLGYLYVQQARPREAIRHLYAVVEHAPDDHGVQLQLGYLYAAVGDGVRARAAFTAALAGPQSAHAERGLAALAQSGHLEQGALFTELYAAPVYQTRFSNLVAPVTVRSGVAIGGLGRAAAYTSVRLTRDTRSVGGVQPQIFSDNVVIPALGVRLQPLGGGPTFYSEVGVARPLLQTPGARTRADYRGGAYHSVQWGERAAAGSERAPRLVGDVYADASYYSRFDDAIAYLQLRQALRLQAWHGGWVELYGRAGAVGDTRRVFYNNVGELGAGLRVLPWRAAGASLSAEYVRGAYWVHDAAATAAPYGELRATVVLSKFVTNRLGTRSW